MEETEPPVEDLLNELQQYEHLQHLHMSKNGIRDISTIAYLPHLLTINVSSNALRSVKFLEELAGSDKLNFLQVCCNDLKTVTSFLLYLENGPQFKQTERAYAHSPAKTKLVESQLKRNQDLR